MKSRESSQISWTRSSIATKALAIRTIWSKVSKCESFPILVHWSRLMRLEKRSMTTRATCRITPSTTRVPLWSMQVFSRVFKELHPKSTRGMKPHGTEEKTPTNWTCLDIRPKERCSNRGMIKTWLEQVGNSIQCWRAVIIACRPIKGDTHQQWLPNNNTSEDQVDTTKIDRLQSTTSSSTTTITPGKSHHINPTTLTQQYCPETKK